MASSVAALASTPSAAKFDPGRMASRIASKMMSELDTNQDGKVSKDEFVAGLKSNGVSVDAANKMFDTIDTQKAGEITKADIVTAVKSGAIKPPVLAADAGKPSRAGGRPVPAKGEGAAQPTSSPTYAAADANHDGTVSPQEAVLYSLKHPTESAATQTDTAQLGQNVDETV